MLFNLFIDTVQSLLFNVFERIEVRKDFYLKIEALGWLK